MARLYNNIGSNYQYRGQHNEAGAYYLKAAGEATKDSTLKGLLAYIYANIGGTLIQIREHEKAVYYFDMAERIARFLKDDRILAHVLGNIGIYYEEKNDFIKSQRYYLESLALSEQHDLHATHLTALTNLGAIYLKQKNYKAALPLFTKVLHLSATQSPYIRINGALYFLGVTHYYLKSYDQAEQYLLASLREQKKLTQKEDNMDAHAILSLVYAAREDYRKAYEHYKAYVALRDSLASEAAARNVNLLETKYRTAQKDKELSEKQLLIARQQIHIERGNTWKWTATVGSLLLLAVLGILYRSYRHKQKLHNERLHNLQQEKAIELLQASIRGEEKERIRLAHELHDGVSSQLSVMKAYLLALQGSHPELAETDDFRQIMQTLNETAGDVRKTAHNLVPDALTQRGLAETARTFCEQIATGRNLRIEFEAYGNFRSLPDYLVLSIYRMIQELVHNILKHAHATHAIILLNRQNDRIHLTVEDNGVGMDPARAGSKGLGLKGLHAKVNALNGYVSLESSPGNGTTIYIELAARTNKKETIDMA